jgi:NitT/TauT family transport system substrate-binding protein
MSLLLQSLLITGNMAKQAANGSHERHDIRQPSKSCANQVQSSKKRAAQYETDGDPDALAFLPATPQEGCHPEFNLEVTMSAKSLMLATAALALGTSAVAAQEKVVFGTNWLAQAEHGGFYQSVADGTYLSDCGFEVQILPGGPQVNNRALMLAGRMDFHMGGDLLQAFSAVQEGVPVVNIAAIFQKHPQVIVAHPGEADSWEELKDLTLLIGDNGYQSYYQWMIKAHGFTEEQRQPYTFNPAPFLADKRVGMQGYLSSEPYLVLKEGGFEPNAFLIADAGYSSYATTIETMADTIANSPEKVQCFVDASIKGWYNFLYGDNAAAQELIKAANPEMTDDKIAYAIDKMKEWGIVDSGKALELGIGSLTDETVESFYNLMVDAGVVNAGIDFTASYTTQFVNKGVGMDLKPAN